ncbi:PREDICTED: uncharacterized protein C11orf70 homolog isoform X2 [Acropora digitifera]|uniref:uncharacterized protein C11orf70 homolog isoform X2 n=1 Tax=Acropora digitifera TaxID=70779 RepID=UPI00077AE858|nr:PREDICTED: uncharacterized protein C11orf70 homolog isoform X2 [Acropora digitifera]
MTQKNPVSTLAGSSNQQQRQTGVRRSTCRHRKWECLHAGHWRKNFFQDPAVRSNLQVVSSNNTWAPLNTRASSTTAEVISCSVTSMDFFDRLQEQGIVRESGSIRKCFDEFYEEFVISDELRKVLLLEEAETYPIFSDADRNEFIFLIFMHLCLGGQVCQYEDEITPYLETTKTLYKDFISVHKDPTTKKLQVGSVVLKVSAQVGRWFKHGGGT